MRKLLFTGVCSLLLSYSLFAQGKVNSNSHYVKAHSRNGTWVEGYHRTNPNNTNRDNYSTLGNINPYTLVPGSILPDNKPLPSYNAPFYTPFTSSLLDYPPTFNINANSTFQTNNIALGHSRSSSSENRSISNTSYFTHGSYDMSAGERVIIYIDGRGIFNVAGSTKTTFIKGLTYYSYDVYNHEIKETVSKAEGHLLLNGLYQFYDKSGVLRISENYRNGLKHGAVAIYDERGRLTEKREFSNGRLIYQKFTTDSGVTFEVFGEMSKPGTRLMLYREEGLFKKVELLGNGREKRIEYAPETQRLTAEYFTTNQKLDGQLRRYQPDGQTLLETANYRNDLREGETRYYFPNGKLQQKIIFKGGMASGPCEVYNESGILIRKGIFLADEPHGEFLNYGEKGILEYRESYNKGVLNGPFIVYQKSKPVLIGTFRSGQKYGRWNYYYLDSTQYYLIQYQTFENGLLNGPFQEIHGDSVWVGSYQNALLDGNIKIYRPFELWLFGIPPRKLSEENLNCVGSYSKGKKTGHWKCYSITQTLVAEGVYLNDVKHGEWRYYLEKFVDYNGQSVPYAGQLFLIENYINGKKYGRSERLAYLKEIPVTCDTTIGTVNPLDTCYALEFKKVREVTYYKNDELHGWIECRDAEGQIILTGEYRQGKKFGHWTEIYSDTDDSTLLHRYEVEYDNDLLNGPFLQFDASTNALLTEGTYVQNGKIGTWKMYFPDGKKVNRISTHNNGTKTTEKNFNYDGKLYLFATYEDDIMRLVEYYDTTRNRILNRIKILSFKDGKYSLDYELLGDTTLQSHIIYNPGYRQPEQDPFLFIGVYQLINQVNPELIQLDGPFSIKRKDGQVLQEGSHREGKKQGDWQQYFYDQKVTQIVHFEDNERKGEKFLKMPSREPFTGKFILPNLQEGGFLQIKVKKGLRHGPTLKYDRNGIMTQKIHYKEGSKIEEKKK